MFVIYFLFSYLMNTIYSPDDSLLRKTRVPSYFYEFAEPSTVVFE